MLSIIPTFFCSCHTQCAASNTQFLLLLSYTVCSQLYPVSFVAVIHSVLSVIPSFISNFHWQRLSILPSFFSCSHTQCAVSNTPHHVTLIDSVFSIIPSFISYSHNMLLILPSSVTYPPRHRAVHNIQFHQLLWQTPYYICYLQFCHLS